MHSPRVETIRGWQWLVEGFELFMRRPGELILMGLTCSLASWLLNFLPWVGWLAALILGPVFLGGLIYAAQRVLDGHEVVYPDLFAGFQDDGKTVRLITLGLVPLAAGVLGAIVGFAMGGLGLWALAQLVIFLLACLAWIIVVLSVPQILFEDADVPASVHSGTDALLENYPAFGLFAGIVILSSVLAFGFLSRLGLSITQPVLGGAIIVLIACATCVAYNDLFSGTATEDAELSDDADGVSAADQTTDTDAP